MFPSDLQANALDLEVRVGNLEENSGDDGNSSIAELELRVDTLEDVTAEIEVQVVRLENVTAEIELRVDTLENDTVRLGIEVNSLEDVIADQETRIVAAEENIQGKMFNLCKLFILIFKFKVGHQCET